MLYICYIFLYEPQKGNTKFYKEIQT